MSIDVGDGPIRLTGMCHLEDAETLYAALQAHPGARIDLSSCQGLHTAVLQVLLKLRPAIAAAPADPFLATWIVPALRPVKDRSIDGRTTASAHDIGSEGTP